MIVTFKSKANSSQVQFSTFQQIETKIKNIIISRVLEGKCAIKGRNVKVSF